MDKEKYTPTVEELVKKMVSKELPIVSTKDIGHGTNSKAIVIGQELCLEKL